MLKRVLPLLWLIAGIGFLFWLYSSNASSFDTLARHNPETGPAIGFVLIVASQVVAPLTGFPIFVALAKIYGLTAACIILYLGFCTSGALNFFIARQYGAPFVGRMVGENMLHRSRVWLHEQSVLYVTLSRILGYYYHDIFSYGWGLTSISFKRYYGVTLIATLIPLIIEYIILSRISLENPRGLLIFYAAMIGIAVSFLGAWALFQLYRRR